MNHCYMFACSVGLEMKHALSCEGSMFHVCGCADTLRMLEWVAPISGWSIRIYLYTSLPYHQPNSYHANIAIPPFCLDLLLNPIPLSPFFLSFPI